MPWRTASALLEIGNESFASIGREYIFEDLNLLAQSPKKTSQKAKAPKNPAEAFHLSVQLSFSGDMSSISATSAESDDSFAHQSFYSETQRCIVELQRSKSFV